MLDLECVLAEGCDAVWPLVEEVELDRVPLPAAAVCFFAFAVLELTVLEPGVFGLAGAFPVAGFAVVDFEPLALVALVFESVLDDCPRAADPHRHANARAQTAPSHLRIPA